MINQPVQFIETEGHILLYKTEVTPIKITTNLFILNEKNISFVIRHLQCKLIQRE